MNLEKAHNCMVRGLQEQIFTAAVLLVAHTREVIFSRAYGTLGGRGTPQAEEKTLFDLASLTKILATTPAWMIMASQSPEILDQPISKWFPSVPQDKRGITPRHLLAHISGLPAWRPYYLFYKFTSAQNLATDNILNEPLEYRTGEDSIYSDLGFILLSVIAEMQSSETLDAFCCERIYEPLGISQDLKFNPSNEQKRIAWTRPEEMPGLVNDLNARCLGGVAGHAGLFGTAEAVAVVAAEISASLHKSTRLFDQKVTQTFCRKVDAIHGCSRALGFDTPSKEASSSGRFFSPLTIGHTGFTGTSLWIDMDRQLTVVLLTNRVFLGESDFRIKSFRPVVHDAVMEEIPKPVK